MFSLFSKPSKSTRPQRRLRKRSENHTPAIPTDVFWYEEAFHDEKPPAYVEFHPSPPDPHPSALPQRPQQNIPLSEIFNKPIPPLPAPSTPIVELAADEVSPSYTGARRRSKTPVLFIGQLEQARSSFLMEPDSNADVGSAELLAAQYQALLVSRFSTPSPIEVGELRGLPPRTIRKVRKISSLRRLMMIEEEGEEREYRESYSDGDTLVGSDFTLTPTSEKGFSNKRLEMKDADDNGDVGLQICLDMLMQELGTGLKTQNISNGSDNSNDLQVLLLIEAYEGLRRRLVEGGGESGGTVRTELKRAIQVLDQWLDALHAIYGEVQSKGIQGMQRMQSTETMRWMPVC